MSNQDHWDRIFTQGDPGTHTWSQENPEESIRLIEYALSRHAGGVIDVGAGTSTLVDHLIRRGKSPLAVVDLSRAALERTRLRLGEAGRPVRFEQADVRESLDLGLWAVWHDRALYHFLVDPEHRAAYRGNLVASVEPGGHAIIGGFSVEGPEHCSGLPVLQLEEERLVAELAPDFELIETVRVVHVTPTEAEQEFLFCVLERLGDAA